MSEEKPKVEVNVVQVVASALAAVSSAVLLSTVGVAGTISGAAVGSVIATVGAALYSYSLRISRERVQAAQASALARMNRARTGPHTGTQTRSLYDEAPHDEPDKAEEQERPPWREALYRLPWKWIAAVAGAVFVVAMIVILSFELLTGQSLSQSTGGSTGTGHRTSFGFGSSSSATRSPTPTPSGGSSGSAGPTAAGSASASSTTPSGPAAEQPTLTPSTSSTPSSAPTTSTPSPSTGITKTPTATPAG